MSDVANWFDKHIRGGIDKYLVDINKDINAEANPDKSAKLKMDFVKLVEQVLCQLPQHESVSNQKINIIISDVQEPPNDNEENRAPSTPNEVCEESE